MSRAAFNYMPVLKSGENQIRENPNRRWPSVYCGHPVPSGFLVLMGAALKEAIVFPVRPGIRQLARNHKLSSLIQFPR
jgi:hypothetical protein